MLWASLRSDVWSFMAFGPLDISSQPVLEPREDGRLNHNHGHQWWWTCMVLQDEHGANSKGTMFFVWEVPCFIENPTVPLHSWTNRPYLHPFHRIPVTNGGLVLGFAGLVVMTSWTIGCCLFQHQVQFVPAKLRSTYNGAAARLRMRREWWESHTFCNKFSRLPAQKREETNVWKWLLCYKGWCIWSWLCFGMSLLLLKAQMLRKRETRWRFQIFFDVHLSNWGRYDPILTYL